MHSTPSKIAPVSCSADQSRIRRTEAKDKARTMLQLVVIFRVRCSNPGNNTNGGKGTTPDRCTRYASFSGFCLGVECVLGGGPLWGRLVLFCGFGARFYNCFSLWLRVWERCIFTCVLCIAMYYRQIERRGFVISRMDITLCLLLEYLYHSPAAYSL